MSLSGSGCVAVLALWAGHAGNRSVGVSSPEQGPVGELGQRPVGNLAPAAVSVVLPLALRSVCDGLRGRTGQTVECFERRFEGELEALLDRKWGKGR